MSRLDNVLQSMSFLIDSPQSLVQFMGRVSEIPDLMGDFQMPGIQNGRLEEESRQTDS